MLVEKQSHRRHRRHRRRAERRDELREALHELTASKSLGDLEEKLLEDREAWDFYQKQNEI